MDVIDDAIEDFTYVLEYYEEWKSALKKNAYLPEVESSVSSDESFFEMTLQRHVSMAKLLAIELHNYFDLYVIEKYKSPFTISRKGKRARKVKFGDRTYKIEVNAEPGEVFGLLDELSASSLSKKELLVINRLFDGALGLCRLQKYMDDRRNDPPAENGRQLPIQMFDGEGGRVVRGVLTLAAHASTEKEIDEHLEVISTCKNVSSLEVNFMNDAQFGLKLILAKLKRMKWPYVTAIQNVEKLEAPVKIEMSVGDAGQYRETVLSTVDPEEYVEDAGASGEHVIPSHLEQGAGDIGSGSTQPVSSPFCKYPEFYDDADETISGDQIKKAKHTEESSTTSRLNPRNCIVQ